MPEMPLMKCGHTAQGYLEENDLKIPCCVICDCKEEVSKPDLDGRQARCVCGSIVPSAWNLAFFEYRGPGSNFALNTCRMCGYNRDIHPSQGGKNSHTCEGKGYGGTFTPGPHQYDSYYCGCFGWD